MSAKSKLWICTVLIFLTVLSGGRGIWAAGTDEIFTDVPADHWAFDAVHKLRQLEITNGIGSNRFGMGMEVKKCEFVSYLVRLMKWEIVSPYTGSFTDNMDDGKWYYSYVETALVHGAISDEMPEFFPESAITREEMAVMIVNALGFGPTAKLMSNIESGFEDVFENRSYIAMARDFGIITGVGAGKFKPKDRAKREEAAAMMIRMYDRLNEPVNELHAFYAINAYPQIDMISMLDSVSFGWSRLELDLEKENVKLNTTMSGNNDYYMPQGYAGPLEYAAKASATARLMIFAENTTEYPLLDHVLTDSRLRKQAIEEIITFLKNNGIYFEGVVIDFEGLRGEPVKQAFVQFLKDLSVETEPLEKTIYVTVHPSRSSSHLYFDGYDFREIGNVADKVILMAHDYYAKQLTEQDMKNGYTLTPLSPLDEVYYALKAITDENTGVAESSKVLFQISFDSVQWKLVNGEVINRYPYRPGYDAIRKRLLTDAQINYYQPGQSTYAVFENNVLWYEDTRSIRAKIVLAAMFRVNGISLWRLGNIPDYEDEGIYLDVWQYILEKAQREVIR